MTLVDLIRILFPALEGDDPLAIIGAVLMAALAVLYIVVKITDVLKHNRLISEGSAGEVSLLVSAAINGLLFVLVQVLGQGEQVTAVQEWSEGFALALGALIAILGNTFITGLFLKPFYELGKLYGWFRSHVTPLGEVMERPTARILNMLRDEDEDEDGAQKAA